MNHTKYSPYPPLDGYKRKWPENTITQAPTWVSSDLRDGNQALDTPLSLEEKIEYFQQLVAFGFKEIEVGFPSATQTDYTFIRYLIEKDLVPKDVTLQILIPPKSEHIKKSFETMEGCHSFIAHLFISTSQNQRSKEPSDLIEEAKKATSEIKDKANDFDGKVVFEFTPEGYSRTELEFARDICQAVINEWEATSQNKAIINIPNTMEKSTPNIFADRTEWLINSLVPKDAIIFSTHTHNDRGTGVAATELALLAGVSRVEGTILGNGERAGNVDLITLAFNVYQQGLDPKLNLSGVDKFLQFVTKMQKMPLHPRHPYVGEMVYSAYSAYHQDAIHKGLEAYEKSDKKLWDVPYLSIDPKDIGRGYEGVARVGFEDNQEDAVHVIEKSLHVKLPKRIESEFTNLIKEQYENQSEEIDREAIIATFKQRYMQMDKPLSLISYDIHSMGGGVSTCILMVRYNSLSYSLKGEARGPLEAACNALAEGIGLRVNILDYHEHTANKGSAAKAVSFIQASLNGKMAEGIGEDEDITISSIKGLISAINNSFL